MNAKEKALELYGKMYSEVTFELSDGYNSLEKNIVAKKCAIIAVNQMVDFLLTFSSLDDLAYRYWSEVKKEIELI